MYSPMNFSKRDELVQATVISGNPTICHTALNSSILSQRAVSKRYYCVVKSRINIRSFNFTSGLRNTHKFAIIRFLPFFIFRKKPSLHFSLY